MSQENDTAGVDFETLLGGGAATYDSAVGKWWSEQSQDSSHKRAYRKIVYSTRDFLRNKSHAEPEFIVDYGCGNGALLQVLHKVFPHTRLIGVDGSSDMLDKCQELFSDGERIPLSRSFDPKGPQIRLCHSRLPSFRFPKGKADLVFLCFPNLMSDENDTETFNRNGYRNTRDQNIAQMLGRFREMDPEDELPDDETPEERMDDLLTDRVFSRNLRHFLKPGGTLIRVEYANAPREEMSQLTRWRTSFADGSLTTPIKMETTPNFFHFLDSRYRKSEVILDVYHQTGDLSDRHGGYWTSFFHAV